MRAKKENIKKATGVGAIKIKRRGMRDDGETDKDRRRRSSEREMGGGGEQSGLSGVLTTPTSTERILGVGVWIT